MKSDRVVFTQHYPAPNVYPLRPATDTLIWCRTKDQCTTLHQDANMKVQTHMETLIWWWQPSLSKADKPYEPWLVNKQKQEKRRAEGSKRRKWMREVRVKMRPHSVNWNSDRKIKWIEKINDSRQDNEAMDITNASQIQSWIWRVVTPLLVR